MDHRHSRRKDRRKDHKILIPSPSHILQKLLNTIRFSIPRYCQSQQILTIRFSSVCIRKQNHSKVCKRDQKLYHGNRLDHSSTRHCNHYNKRCYHICHVQHSLHCLQSCWLPDLHFDNFHQNILLQRIHYRYYNLPVFLPDTLRDIPD